MLAQSTCSAKTYDLGRLAVIHNVPSRIALIVQELYLLVVFE